MGNESPSGSLPLSLEETQDVLPEHLGENHASVSQVVRIERLEKIRRYMTRTAMIFSEMKKQQASLSQLHEIHELEKKLSQSPTVKDYISLAHRYSALGFNADADRMLELAEKCQVETSPHPDQLQENLISGAIAPLMLIEVLQLLSRTNRTGELVLDTPQGAYYIYLDRGQIVNATSATHEPGLASFYMGVRAARGTYRFITLPEMNVEHLIEDRTEHLIMEAARLMDESSPAAGEDGAS